MLQSYEENEINDRILDSIFGFSCLLAVNEEASQEKRIARDLFSISMLQSSNRRLGKMCLFHEFPWNRTLPKWTKTESNQCVNEFILMYSKMMYSMCVPA